MKLPTKKQKIQYPLHFYIFSVTLFVLSASIYPTYLLAQKYHREQIQHQTLLVKKSIDNLTLHNLSLLAIKEMESSIAALKNDKLDASGAEAELEKMKRSFIAGAYRDVLNGKENIGSISAKLYSEDQQTHEELNKKLSDLTKKRDDYKKQGVEVATISAAIASASAYLNDKEYGKIPGLITSINGLLDYFLAKKKEADKLAAARAASAAAAIAPVSNGGVTYERKTINTSIGPFTADILTVDLNRVKAKTFTANDSDCKADCPLKPLASYVSENGGIAGINGTYFCPADYASCADVKNSFNTLVFDYRTKHYLNSDQNVYSVNPLVSFYPDGAHYYTQALGFGRDTSAYGVISNFPTLIHNGGIATNSNLDAKSAGSKTIRGGIGWRGKTLWAVQTRGATVPDTSYVFQSLGAEYAMNLDGGGSAALYFGGYKVGPGRNLPNAIVFTP